MKRTIVYSVVMATMCIGIVVTTETVRSHNESELLVISRLILVTSREIDRHLVEDVHRAEVRHAGSPGSPDYAGVTARAAHPRFLARAGLPVQIVDGDLDFGNVRTGDTAESRDTFTICREGEGLRGTENEGYADRQTALMFPNVRIISMREEYAQIGMQVLCCQARTELAGRIANKSSISTADRREAVG